MSKRTPKSRRSMPGGLKTALDYVVYLAVRLLICVIQALPLEVCHRGSKGLAWLLSDVLGVRRKVVEENLRIAFPEASEAERLRITRGMWEHLLLMLCEVAHAPRKLHRTNLQQHGGSPQQQAITSLLLDERPLVMISGHLGNFELGGYLMGMHGFPTYTVARPLDNRFLHEFIGRFRGATGQHMLPKNGSSGQIEEVLKRGETFALLGDQYAGTSGCWVEFFGRPASTHKAVSLFTLGSRAPTAFCAAVRTGGPLDIEMWMTSRIDPESRGFELGTIPLLAQWYTSELEGLIRTFPEQYWWLHRRWRDDVTDRKSLRRMRRAARAA